MVNEKINEAINEEYQKAIREIEGAAGSRWSFNDWLRLGSLCVVCFIFGRASVQFVGNSGDIKDHLKPGELPVVMEMRRLDDAIAEGRSANADHIAARIAELRLAKDGTSNETGRIVSNSDGGS